MNTVNVDEAEVRKFSRTVDDWWDPSGDFRTLHMLNPVRIKYIQNRTSISAMKVLDVGCGGGILSEGLANEGGRVTAIDISEQAIFAAKRHLQYSELSVNYICATAEQYAEECSNEFDIITCMELLEHVPDPSSLLMACTHMLKPNGHLFLSTINRTPKSWLFGVVGAEYVLNVLPRGTHHHKKFIRPSELFEWCQNAGLAMRDITGLHYNPLSNSMRLGPGVDINYFAHCQRT